jgi:hypothetical protein
MHKILQDYEKIYFKMTSNTVIQVNNEKLIIFEIKKETCKHKNPSG